MPATATTTATHDRLLDALAHTLGKPVDRVTTALLHQIPMTDPAALSAALGAVLPARFSLTGTLDRRLLMAEQPGCDRWIIADLSGQPHTSRDWPQWTRSRLTIAKPDVWLSPAVLSDDAVRRLQLQRTRSTVPEAAAIIVVCRAEPRSTPSWPGREPVRNPDTTSARTGGVQPCAETPPHGLIPTVARPNPAPTWLVGSE